MRAALVLSCEHATNFVPGALLPFFADAAEALLGHRGWDPGALVAARAFARRFDAPLQCARVSRLVVDANRSRENRHVLSEWTRGLPEARREALLERWWSPHRDAVRAAVDAALAGGERVLHVSVHSFTPVLDGRVRDVDVGFLFDPARPAERAAAEAWRRALRTARPDLRLAFNRPYRGTSDGLTTSLRAALPTRRYLGLELELNQAIAARPAAEWAPLRRALGDALEEALAAVSRTPRPAARAAAPPRRRPRSSRRRRA